MPDLSLVSTNDLVLALAARFDHLLIMGRLDRTDDSHFSIRHHSGDNHICIGLAQIAAVEMTLKRLATERRDLDDLDPEELPDV